MKKIFFTIIILISVIALIVLIAAPHIPDELMQHSFKIGNFVITDRQPMREWITDTPVTDYSEKF